MIVFTRYKKYFDKKLVIDIPEVDLSAGVYWLKGENGSGKTTLLKSVAGIIPFEGEISVDGLSIRDQRAAYKLIVNYGEAEPIYPGFLTGTDLLHFYRNAKCGDERLIRSLVDSLGVAAYMGSRIGTYSSGMAKKLSLVLAFVGNPKLILLDEPLITLDTRAQGPLQHLIARYHERGVSFLVTSHQPVSIPGVSIAQLMITDNSLQRL